jgi:transcriptional regulator with XRE-family HTH domain
MEKSTFTSEYLHLKELLRNFRIEAGLTQIQLAEKLGETQSFVSKCERGERRLDLVQLRQFCLAMGVDLQVFVAAFEQATSRRTRSR